MSEMIDSVMWNPVFTSHDTHTILGNSSQTPISYLISFVKFDFHSIRNSLHS